MAVNENVYDIFISYERDHLSTDKAVWVETLAKNLRNQGYKIFLDLWSEIPGESRAQQLHNAAAHSLSSIIVGTAETIESSWQRKEYNLLLQKELEEDSYTILAVVLGGDIPNLPFLKTKVCINIESSSEESYRRAFHKILCGLKSSPPEDGTFQSQLIIPHLSDGESQSGNILNNIVGSMTLDSHLAWRCVDVSLQADGKVVCYDENGTTVNTVPADQIIAPSTEGTFTQDQILIEMNELLTPLFDESKSEILRLRIRTSTPALANLPWALVDTSAVIELSPLSSHFRCSFTAVNLSNPLVAIPDDPPDISSNSHYRLLHDHFSGSLNIRGPIPRVTTAITLKNELELHQPDIFYIYAGVNNGKVQLDDSLSGEGNKEFTLDQLADWIKVAEIRPIVILSLLGEELNTYPEALVTQCRLLWIQSTSRKPKYKKLAQNVLDVLDQLQSTPDLIQLINSSFLEKGINNQLWVNGISPEIKVEKSTSIYQLRAALLRILLGRDDLKSKLSNDIRDPAKQSKIPCINYAVTGDENACPFDVPTQLRQKLEWDEPDITKAIPFINFHLPITLDPSLKQQSVIDNLVDSSLVGRNGDIESTFKEELERRGLLSRSCCISLNWRLKIANYEPQELEQWLLAWQKTLDELFIDDIPKNVTLVNAICVEINSAERANEVQTQINSVLQSCVLKKAMVLSEL